MWSNNRFQLNFFLLLYFRTNNQNESGKGGEKLQKKTNQRQRNRRLSTHQLLMVRFGIIEVNFFLSCSNIPLNGKKVCVRIAIDQL